VADTCDIIGKIATIRPPLTLRSRTNQKYGQQQKCRVKKTIGTCSAVGDGGAG